MVEIAKNMIERQFENLKLITKEEKFIENFLLIYDIKVEAFSVYFQAAPFCYSNNSSNAKIKYVYILNNGIIL